MNYAVTFLLYVALQVGSFACVTPNGQRVVITSTQTADLEVYIDAELVGTQVPLDLKNVPLGMHTLLARAPGYKDKAYQFELMPGAPALIEITLEPGQNPPLPPGAPTAEEIKVMVSNEPAGMGTVFVAVEPTAAEVYVDGDRLPGSAPHSLHVPVGQHTILIRAPGYEEKAFRFDLQSEEPAIIETTLAQEKGSE